MKKLLLLLISLLLSFNSYGEWTKLFTDEDGTTWHINIETIKERDGSVYLWQMNSSKEGSSTMLSENDCDLVRTKFIQMYDYDEPMLEGDSTLVPTDGTEWMFLPPETIGEFILQFACELAPQSQEERLETVFELTKFIEEEQEQEKQDKLTEQQKKRQTELVNSIGAKVYSNWHYQGAKDDWWCEVFILQKRNGEVELSDIHRCANVSGANEEAFKGSIIRAVYNSSPLPYVSDDAVFDEQINLVFFVN